MSGSSRKSGARASQPARGKHAVGARSARRRARAVAPDRGAASASEVEAARQVVSRAIRRLNLLETLIVAVAVGVALLGGWLGALLARSALGLPLRTTWMALSVLLFVVPAVLAWTMERRKRSRARMEADAAARENPTGGQDG